MSTILRTFNNHYDEFLIDVQSIYPDDMDLKTFYDRDDLSFRKEIVDCIYAAAMNPTAGSFIVADRVQRHFAVIACDIPSEAESKGIYLQVLQSHFEIKG